MNKNAEIVTELKRVPAPPPPNSGLKRVPAPPPPDSGFKRVPAPPPPPSATGRKKAPVDKELQENLADRMVKILEKSGPEARRVAILTREDVASRMNIKILATLFLKYVTGKKIKRSLRGGRFSLFKEQFKLNYNDQYKALAILDKIAVDDILTAAGVKSVDLPDSKKKKEDSKKKKEDSKKKKEDSKKKKEDSKKKKKEDSYDDDDPYDHYDPDSGKDPYDDSPISKPKKEKASKSKPKSKKGKVRGRYSNKDYVKAVQEIINFFSSLAKEPKAKGGLTKLKSVSKLTVDGIYGPRTRAAVKAFQRMVKTKVDGYWGPKTSCAFSKMISKTADSNCKSPSWVVGILKKLKKKRTTKKDQKTTDVLGVDELTDQPDDEEKKLADKLLKEAKNMQAKELEIIRGIAQAASMGYDGALDDEGKPIKIGLKRDEGNPIVDSRHMDGFKISFKGPVLCLKYQTEVKLKDVHQKGFENEIRSAMNSIASFLKKEYKKATKKNLNLTSMGEPKIDIQRISSVRSDLHAFQEFKIGGLTNTLKYGHLESKEENERKIEDSIRKFLELGRKK